MNPMEWKPQRETAVVDESTALRDAGHSRRAFLFKLALGLNGVVGAIMAVPVVGYLLGAATEKRAEAETWVRLGPLASFPEGQTRIAVFRNPTTTEWDGMTADISCWVRRVSATKFQVFAVNCAHLGCPVRWFEESRLFLCPCHGGAYYEDGSRASGPPERGLFEYDHRVDGDQLAIFAGKMPTLAAKLESKSALTQIANVSARESASAPKPRCGSCQG